MDAKSSDLANGGSMFRVLSSWSNFADSSGGSRAIAGTVLGAAAFLISACDLTGRTADSCASATDLTASIAGKVYKIPAVDRPTLEAINPEDVFAPLPGGKGAQSPALIYCQRENKVPVLLESLEVRPPSLAPRIKQISLSNRQRENRLLPPLEAALVSPWNALPTKAPDQHFKLENSDVPIRVSCNSLTAKDVYGNPREPLCDTRMAIGSGGTLRIHFSRPDDWQQARRDIVEVAKYLNSIELGNDR